MLNSVETVRLLKQGFHVLARAADEIELPQSGLGMSVAGLQSRREFLRPVVQSVLEAGGLVVGVDEGLKRESAVNLDHVQTVERARLVGVRRAQWVVSSYVEQHGGLLRGPGWLRGPQPG